MNKKIILSIMTVIVFMLTISVTYAWFTNVETSQPIIIKTGSLTADFHFYQKLNDDYQEVTEKLNFNNAIPGEIYEFRIVVSNEGTIDGNLTFVIDEILFSNQEILSGFKLSFYNPQTKAYQEIPLAEYNDQLIIFEKYYLEKNEQLIFDFKIHLSGCLASEGKLSITQFAIILEQIH